MAIWHVLARSLGGPGAVPVRSWCGPGAVLGRYTGAVLGRYRCGPGGISVRSRCGPGAVQVRSWECKPYGIHKMYPRRLHQA